MLIIIKAIEASTMPPECHLTVLVPFSKNELGAAWAEISKKFPVVVK